MMELPWGRKLGLQTAEELDEKLEFLLEKKLEQ